MIQFLLPFLKYGKTYWKTGGLILLGAAFLLFVHLAKSRGEKLAAAEQALQTERSDFSAQLKQIEKARQDEKERNGFRQKQNRKISPAGGSGSDNDLRDAYEQLRQRQSAHLAR